MCQSNVCVIFFYEYDVHYLISISSICVEITNVDYGDVFCCNGSRLYAWLAQGKSPKRTRAFKFGDISHLAVA